MGRKTIAWTEEELAILKEKFPQYGGTGCMQFLPGRTKNGINNKARWLNITMTPEAMKRMWQQTAARASAAKQTATRNLPRLKALIKERYRDEGPDGIAAETGYNRQRVMNVASSMGICMSSKTKRLVRVSKMTTREWLEKNTSDIEKLALYLPWRNYPREKRERMYRV